MTDTFGMLHLVFKRNRAPPLPGHIPLGQQMRGAVCGEVIQQHHICTCTDKTLVTLTKQDLFMFKYINYHKQENNLCNQL